jgi:hypothetical protein
VELSQTHTQDSSETVDTEEANVEEGSPDAPEVYTVTLTVDSAYEYDSLYGCLLNHRQKLIGTNQSGIDTVTELIGELRMANVGDEIELTLTESEINNLHNALLQHRLNYQGKGMREQLSAAKSVEAKFNAERERLLF